MINNYVYFAADWLKLGIIAVIVAPIWMYLLSLPVSPITSQFMGFDWSDDNRRRILIVLATFIASDIVAASVLIPWIRQINSWKQIVTLAIILPFILAAIFGLAIYWGDILFGTRQIDPYFSLENHPIKVVLYNSICVLGIAVAGAIGSSYIGVPLAFLQLLISRKLMHS